MRLRKPQPRSERREAPRFSVVLPVKLEQGEGWTRDVIAGGVFFTTQGALSSGERIRFTLVLEHVDPNGALAIPCEAKWSASSHSTPPSASLFGSASITWTHARRPGVLRDRKGGCTGHGTTRHVHRRRVPAETTTDEGNNAMESTRKLLYQLT